jgi:hypothetical protein
MTLFTIVFLVWLSGMGIGLYKHIIGPSRRWSAALTIEEYAKQNPEAKTQGGMSCVFCGSRSIRNWGIIDAKSPKRLHICNHCGKTLYRSKV